MTLKRSDYFYCLMKRYEEKLMAYVRRLSYLPEADMADIVQESFIKTYQNLNDCDCRLKFSSWLYRITHNQLVNFLRKHKLKFKVSFEEEREDLVEWLASETDIEKETIKKHFGDYIQTVLDKLKPEYKEILVLRFFEEKDYKEIADILKKPMGTVATLLSRAKIEFKKIYDNENKN